MTFVVLFILAVVWALYLASWLRNKAQTRSANSISSFSKHLSVLERARPVSSGAPAPALRGVEPGATPVIRSSVPPARRDPMVRPPQVRGLLGGTPVTRRDVRRRRRDVLLFLVAIAVSSLIPAFVLGGFFLWVAAGAWMILGSYVFLLVRAQHLAMERREKVTYLASQFDEPYYGERVEPALVRTAR